MKTLLKPPEMIILVLIFLLIKSQIFAQPPQQISYQAIIRNSNNELVKNANIGLKIIIINEIDDNTEVVYTETQTPKTNENGLMSVAIGHGSSTDELSDINWANGLFFIKTEVDLDGGTNYTIEGMSQILSVPFAFYAHESGTPGTEGPPGADGVGIDDIVDNEDGTFTIVLTDETDFTTPDFTGAPGEDGISLVDVEIIDNHLMITLSNDDVVDAGEIPSSAMPSGNNPGEILYWDGDNWISILPGKNGQALVFCNGVPTWGSCDSGDDEPVFIVDNRDGENVFSVFQDGVVINLQDLPDKSARGSFAVGGFTTNKESLVDLLLVSADSVRVYIDKTDTYKSARGSFAVGGFTTNKENIPDSYLEITSDTIYITTAMMSYGDISVAGNIYTGGSVSSPPISDVEGNVYHTIKIGAQTWMKENLKTAFYNHDLQDPIGLNDAFFYNNEIDNVSDYGVLYSWFAAHESASQICPVGWRLPSQYDWERLLMFIGGTYYEENQYETAARMMEDTNLWSSPEVIPNNQSGFSARPSGKAEFDPGFGTWGFSELGIAGYFWGQAIGGGPMAYKIHRNFGLEVLYSINPDEPNAAFSIRCIKDE